MNELEDRIVQMMKTIYDPEIPVDIFELGLIYEVKIEEGKFT
jgi:metal-sulfur cluster biosynthetic enzyme